MLKLKRLVSLLLAVLMIAGLSTICLTASAAETETTSTGVKIGTYYNVDYLEDKAYNGTDLGCTYTPSKTTWKVWSPDADKVQLKLYATGSDMESGAKNLGKYDLKLDQSTGVWSISLDGDYKNVYYTYVIKSKAGTNETYDIYAKAAGVNGDRSMVVDLDSTDPDGWDKDEHVFYDSQTDRVIWEVHIADLTSSDTSGVDKNYQGKFLGFMEGGLTINGKDGAKKVGIDYLVEQGIDAVHIQCPFDFASGDETNPESYNWGYDPKNYNLPEGMYSTNPYDGNVRIREFKQLIQALHDRGIAVIMGVVYNHTYVTEQSAFTYTVPGYYYRMSSSTFYINGTGCGNTTASDKKMFRNYMMQSLKYWVEEYHIDGFRFDIMGAHDIETMNLIRAMFDDMYGGEGKKIIMYGEPWGAGDVGIQSSYTATTPNFSKLSSNIAGFNSDTRQAMHGSESGTTKGWFQGATTNAYVNKMKRAALGKFSSDAYIKYPNQSINYVDCHDGVTWWDNILMAQRAASATNKAGFDTTEALYRQQLRTSFTFLFTTQGIPFTLAGTEFARSKYGNGNSYNAGETNAFDWTRIETYATEVAYAKGMREIRAAYSPFRNGTTYNTLNWLTTSSANSILAYQLDNNKSGEWSSVIVAVNNGAAGTVTLPSGSWTIIANGEKAGLTSLGTASGTYNIAANGSAILVQGTTAAKSAEYNTVTVNHYVGDKLIKSNESLYKVGDTWRANPDSYTIFDHKIVKIEATSGTKTGDSYYGTVDGTSDVVVSYYYEQTSPSGYLTVKYVDENGETISADVAYRMLDGTEYNIPFENVAGYELISDKYPTNFKGVFDAENPATITFTYKQLEVDKITVYYYNALGDNYTPRMYAYTETEDKPLGAWNNSGQTMTKVTDASELPDGEEVGKWFKKEIVTPNSNVDYLVTSCKVMFLRPDNSLQEPLNGEAGYDASGTIYVKNKIVTFNADVVVSHIDANTGKKLAADERIAYDNVTSNEIYVASPKAGLGTVITPSNASGNLVAGSTCVVFMYDTSDDPKPTTPDPKPTTPTGSEEGGILLGDADLDGNVNVKDATLIQKYAASISLLSDNALLAADVDGSGGKPNVRDATAIQKFVANIETGYAIGETIPGTGKPVTPTEGSGDNNDPTTPSEGDGLVAELTALYGTASTLLNDNKDYVVESPLSAEELALKADFGFVVSQEDTSKNEYQKFNKTLSDAGFYVVQGGTDAELQTAINDLSKASSWFEHYVTEVHPEPVVGGSSGDGGTIYFSNNKGWSTVNIYYWASGTEVSWPGVPMTYVETNDWGEEIYSFDLPSGIDNVIFNNGMDGNSNQTADIIISAAGGNGFYLDSQGSNGKWSVGVYTR
ncbi:MAG: type I pullulanase [Ruminococcus sp.]